MAGVYLRGREPAGREMHRALLWSTQNSSMGHIEGGRGEGEGCKVREGSITEAARQEQKQSELGHQRCGVVQRGWQVPMSWVGRRRLPKRLRSEDLPSSFYYY